MLFRRKRENETDGVTDSDTAINNICARKKTISIRRKNVLSTSESEDNYIEDTLVSSS